MNWINYKVEKPKLHELVAVCRDVNGGAVFIVNWSKEEEKYADLNNVTHWFLVTLPNDI
tara:strand:+ start:1444 stop:1620 length:177 start_codon:yes stop_codon:yes gene_type:complete